MHAGIKYIIAEIIYDIIQNGIERAYQSEFYELPQRGKLFILISMCSPDMN